MSDEVRGEKLRRSKRSSSVAQALRVALGMSSTLAIVGGAASGCLDRPIEPVEPRTTSTVVDVLTQSSVDKIDVVIVIDNSGSMGDKQEILALAVPKLVERLVTPVCVNVETGLAGDPAVNIDGDGKCPEGFEAEFSPVRDINIGVVSSSLGSAGTELCATTAGGNPRPNNQDYGHLLWRSTPNTTNNDIPTYQNLGFLAWDPDGKRPCPGDEGETCAGSSNPTELIDTLRSMVQGVGEVGCGLEAPLEAAYRFLVDPAPWADFAGPGQVSGTDDVLLEQRKAFLRPDSLVAVILLTDENDCSVRNDGIGHIVATPQGVSPLMPKARSECAANPDDACCKSCIEDPGDCSGDGGCAAPGDQQNPDNYWPDQADANGVNENAVNLRCFDQKRRFGIDFLYPTQRYVNAFSQPLINPGVLDLAAQGKGDVQNPLYTDLRGLGRSVRKSDLVFVAGIAGVPWQLIARKNEAGEPDLNAGLNTTVDPPRPDGGFQTYDELQKNGVWDLLIPQNGADQPDDPHMIESPFPRDGLSSSYRADPIHGNEWDTAYGDLQYACIFPLPQAAQRTCTEGAGSACDCSDGANAPNKPLCNATTPLLQDYAKAYPGTRIFEVLNGLGGQGIPASICPAQLGLNGESDAAKDFGYTPAVFAIIDRLKTKLGGSCQPRQLTADKDGNVPCLVIEARDSDGDKKANTTSKCSCDESSGRAEVREDSKAAVDKIKADEENTEPRPGWDCYCEITQLQGDPTDESSDRYQCQNNEAPPGDVNGWCYVDATSVPPVGNPDLVDSCPATERRLVRFVNEGEVTPGATLFITCAGD